MVASFEFERDHTVHLVDIEALLVLIGRCVVGVFWVYQQLSQIDDEDRRHGQNEDHADQATAARVECGVAFVC